METRCGNTSCEIEKKLDPDSEDEPYIEFRYKILMTMTRAILTIEDHLKGDKHLI